MDSGVYIENTLNRDGDILPFGYYNPINEGRLSWVCNYGITGTEIVSVFTMTPGVESATTEKNVKYLLDEKEAIYCRDELIKNGWLPLKLPEINITSSGGKNLNRREKREIDKQIKKASKK